MITDILPGEVGILCGKIVSEGKRTDHSQMHRKIAEYRKSHMDIAPAYIKAAVYHAAYEYCKDDEEKRYDNVAPKRRAFLCSAVILPLCPALYQFQDNVNNYTYMCEKSSTFAVAFGKNVRKRQQNKQ